MMQINVSEILSTSGKSQSFQAEAGFDVIPYSGVEYPVAAKESFDLTVSNVGKKKIHVTGETKVVLLIPCDRCLNDVSVEFPIKIDVVIDRNTEDDDENAKIMAGIISLKNFSGEIFPSVFTVIEYTTAA